MNSSQTNGPSTWRSGELPPLLPQYPQGVIRYPNARVTKPFVHEPHDWIVSEDFQVPTHELDDCATCRVWNDHTRRCVESAHCRAHFEHARAESARSLRLEAYQVLEEKLDTSRQPIEELTRLVETRDARIDNLATINAGLMGRLMESTGAGEQLGEQLCRTLPEMRQLQTQLRAAQSSATPETSPQPTIPLPRQTASQRPVIDQCSPTPEEQAGCLPGVNTRPAPSPALSLDAQPGLNSEHAPSLPLPSRHLCPNVQPGLNSGHRPSPPLSSNAVHAHRQRSHLWAGPTTIVLHTGKGKERTTGDRRWKARIRRKST